MQRSGPAPTQTAAPFSGFSSFFGVGSSNPSTTTNNATSSPAKSRPGSPTDGSPRQPNVLHKDRDRRPSFGRKASFSSSSPSKPGKRRTSSSNGVANGLSIVTSDSSVPPLPDFALAAAARLSRDTETIQSPASADSFSKMLSRTTPTPMNGYGAVAGQLAPPAQVTSGQPSELSVVHQHIHDTANKRVSTLDYLRKAHEGRVYWFNTLLFDKPDLARMPYFDSRKLARRATNYLLLGISLPTVTDLNSNSAVDFLRSLNTLLTEFDAFQALHSESGTTSSSLSRARIPHMFRRAGPISKGRRSSSATDAGYGDGSLDGGNGGVGGTASSTNLAGLAAGSSTSLASGGGGGGTSAGAPLSAANSNGTTANSVPPASVINFAASETDLLPGEEYTHLLTPSLPFDPDFFETFATLCDVLIDTYTRLLSLVPTPRECGGSVAEMFTKVDSRVRKIIVQGVIKEFEDSSRAGVKAEVGNIGRVVLGGLM
ncbi:hypothetical protein B0T25DRAFT_600017 [Lasiosphaeria hispida]|uniref:Uncharacterized protein n=1 Tax=Lasiosphaeria hispida TaxID=260671 RepID=A0AAJ0HPZ6_9PEZI|nr:hypothetical protein B0T25DRAFT_600017 [Lasiosphaeria hispida]